MQPGDVCDVYVNGQFSHEDTYEDRLQQIQSRPITGGLACIGSLILLGVGVFILVDSQRKEKNQKRQANVSAYLRKSAELMQLKRYQEALEATEEAIRLDPASASASLNKGAVLEELKRYEEALAAYDQVIRLDPVNSGGYYKRVHALCELKRYEEALAAFDKALRMGFEPSFHMYNDKGTALLALERYEEALAAFDRAIRCADAPRYAQEAYKNKSEALRRLGREEEAEQARKEAERLG
jgi:pentatricopeptide repeat protein